MWCLAWRTKKKLQNMMNKNIKNLKKNIEEWYMIKKEIIYIQFLKLIYLIGKIIILDRKLKINIRIYLRYKKFRMNQLKKFLKLSIKPVKRNVKNRLNSNNNPCRIISNLKK